mmetsp:Transcript_10646/g.12207  ORF Transcript_10646/g.12207 Transcript_10646/m.12207 type:complete len:211 (-) Transcript_10646:2175-2807(-)
MKVDDKDCKQASVATDKNAGLCEKIKQLSKKGRASRFTSSKRFKAWCKKAFETVDLDKSNTLDSTEVYCAVLYVYTIIISYVATAVPPSREFVLELFNEIDIDNSGSLNLEEFEALSVVLFSHILNRIVTEAAIYFILGPIFAGFLFQFLDSVFETPSWIPSSVSSLLLNFRDMFLVTLIVLVVVPQLLKMYEHVAHKRTHILAQQKKNN